MADSFDTDPLAGRLSATFEAEAAALADRGDPTEELIVLSPRADSSDGDGPSWWQRSIVPLAAALVLVVGVGAVLALSNRAQDPPPNDLAAAASRPTPEPVATEEPSPPTTPLPTPHSLTPEVPQPVPATTPVVPPPPFDPVCVTGIVAPDTLNLRSGPGLGNEVILELEPGRCGIVRTGDLVDGWMPVDVFVDNSGTRAAGWLSARFVGPDTFAPPAPVVVVDEPVIEPGSITGVPPFQPGLFQRPLCVVGIVAPDVLNVRSGPGVDNPIVFELQPEQCRIYIAGDSVGAWAPVLVSLGPDGDVEGWVSTRYLADPTLAIDPPQPMVTIIVRFEYLSDDPDSVPPTTSFEVIDSEGGLLGNLDESSRARVPANLDPSTFFVQAPFPDDPYCGWTGPLDYDAPGGRYFVKLLALCA